jgi:hypothetical protein
LDSVVEKLAQKYRQKQRNLGKRIWWRRRRSLDLLLHNFSISTGIEEVSGFTFTGTEEVPGFIFFYLYWY